ncbi:MAG: hypothetical protein ACKOCX_10315, partial [Planctomycetota bacterium]
MANGFRGLEARGYWQASGRRLAGWRPASVSGAAGILPADDGVAWRTDSAGWKPAAAVNLS